MKIHWVIGIVIAAGLNAQAQNCNVDVFVQANVSIDMGKVTVLAYGAKSKVIAMFGDIGVHVRMWSGIPSGGKRNSCGAPIVVLLENATGYHGPEGALAYALPYGKSGTCIHVFLDRVMRKSDNQGLTDGLLAHVLVHEITHVLQGVARHSGEGVMKAVWSHNDYQRMSRDPLPFAQEDVDLMREGLALRNAHGLAE